MQFRSRQDMGIRTPDDFRRMLGGDETHLFLIEHMKNLPRAHAAALFDTDGEAFKLNTSSMTRRQLLRRRRPRLLPASRDQSTVGVVVSHPLIGRGLGVSTILFARRISGRDGRFLGVAVVSVDVRFLLDQYEEISRERHIAVTLMRNDGVVLARYPAIQVTGVMPAESPWWAAVAAGGENLSLARAILRMRM